MDDLDRMFRRLVQNIRNGFPEYLTRPFEVSELYQTLIPYRHNRRELGIETNQDYEAALCLLIAGEKGYLGGDADMQAAIQREMHAANPNTAIFREFAASRIAVSADALRRLDQGEPAPARSTMPVTPPPMPSPPAGVPTTRGPITRDAPLEAPSAASAIAPAAMPSAAPAREVPREAAREAPRAGLREPPHDMGREIARDVPREVAREVPRDVPRAAAPTPRMNPSLQDGYDDGAPASTTPQSVRAAAAPRGGSCSYCGGTLPADRQAMFCPHCGQNLTVRRCPACSSELELDWKYCITCGRGVS